MESDGCGGCGGVGPGYVSDPGQPKTASPVGASGPRSSGCLAFWFCCCGAKALVEGGDVRSATTVQDESSNLESTPSMSSQPWECGRCLIDPKVVQRRQEGIHHVLMPVTPAQGSARGCRNSSRQSA